MFQKKFLKYPYVFCVLINLAPAAFGQAGKALAKCQEIRAPGKYYLTADVSCSSVPFAINANNVILNLNGHTVTFGSASAVTPAFTICDAWYKGLNGCTGTGHHASPEIYGGKVTEVSDAQPFTPVFWIGQANGLNGGSIHDLTATFGGMGSQFVHGDYPGVGWRIYNNTLNDDVKKIEHDGQGTLSARSQFQGVAIYLNHGANAPGTGDRIYGNTINGSPQGGIQTTAQNSQIYNNVLTLSSYYSNDYGIMVLADGQHVHDNKIAGRGRGLDGESSNFVFDHNTIDVHEEKNNTEYNGCELGGADGIRIKNYDSPRTGWSVTNNDVTVNATDCPGVALRLTSLNPHASGVISTNFFSTKAGGALDAPLSFEGDNQADLKFVNNVFSGSSIHIDWDGVNEVVQSGQTWNLTGPIVQDMDGQKSGPGDNGAFVQRLTVADIFAQPTVVCGSFAAGLVQIGTYTKQCP